MKQCIIITVFITHSVVSYCQNLHNTLFVDVPDTYVISAKIIRKVFESKCTCGMEGIQESTQCTLYKAIVDSVYLLRDTLVYNDLDLHKVDYFVMASNSKISVDKIFLAFCSNSTTRNYLVINKFASIDSKYDYATAMPVVVGLTTCYKYTIWEKLLLFFGGDRTTINEKAKRRFDEQNPFQQAIARDQSR